MRYVHDCDLCKPLGECGTYDLYVCHKQGAPTVIARYGSEGSEYNSGLVFSYPENPPSTPALVEARLRAENAGLLPRSMSDLEWLAQLRRDGVQWELGATWDSRVVFRIYQGWKTAWRPFMVEGKDEAEALQKARAKWSKEWKGRAA